MLWLVCFAPAQNIGIGDPNDFNKPLDIQGEIIMKDTGKSVGIMPKGYEPKQNLNVLIPTSTGRIRTSPTGNIGIGLVTEKQISISIERYNKLTKHSNWELLDAYVRKDCYTTLWKNKKTGKSAEVIGTYPPSERLNVGGAKSN
jgi:hypothetical protein